MGRRIQTVRDGACSPCKDQVICQQLVWMGWPLACEEDPSILRRLSVKSAQALADSKWPDHYCDCECGGITNRAQSSNKTKGQKRGQPRRYLPRHFIPVHGSSGTRNGTA